ncbi:hypothetical protein ES319_D13G006800v1 [Gossypium barbadense]|uniref:GED domain-containing protein n=1 Tax=Gossypium barbadense TaxID=3634 RepID=A0A5J5NFU7_GOSBA|nr:hypothetical protein ES319_D13G006800v1 [Gossypium barbadense]
MLNRFSDELHNCEESNLSKDFLTEEIKGLEDAKRIELPNFLPCEAFLRIFRRKVERISYLPIKFTEKYWDYIDDVVTSVLTRHSEMYYQLKVSAKGAAHNLVQKLREQSINRVKEIVEMEKLTGYTCNPDYMREWNELMNQQDYFINQITGTDMMLPPYPEDLQGFGKIQVEHLRQHSNVLILQQAFDLKMRTVAYWKIFKVRLVDSMALHLQYCVHNLVNNDIDEIVKELMGPDGHGMEKMLVESPAIVAKRENLKNSIKVLKESKDSVAKVMDRIVVYDAYLV